MVWRTGGAWGAARALDAPLLPIVRSAEQARELAALAYGLELGVPNLVPFTTCTCLTRDTLRPWTKSPYENSVITEAGCYSGLPQAKR